MLIKAPLELIKAIEDTRLWESIISAYIVINEMYVP